MTLKVNLQVEHYRKTSIERERGYLPVERTRHFQRLVAIVSLWKLQVMRLTVDTEEVPEHVMISVGCFGDTGGWRSKFAAYIQ